MSGQMFSPGITAAIAVRNFGTTPNPSGSIALSVDWRLNGVWHGMSGPRKLNVRNAESRSFLSRMANWRSTHPMLALHISAGSAVSICVLAGIASTARMESTRRLVHEPKSVKVVTALVTKT